MDKPKISVVIPTYNEIENIADALKNISESLGKNLYEIIVVDDNSPDGTWKIVQEMKNPKYKLIRRMNEKGLASALARGVAETKGNIVVWLDCDSGVPPQIIPKLVEKLQGSDVVVGSRYVPGGKDMRSALRALASYLLNLFASIVLGFAVRDYTSGVIAVKKEVTEKIPLSPHGFGEYFIEFVYRCLQRGYKITEVGYVYTTREKGVSKSDGDLFTLLKYGFQYGMKVIRLKFRDILEIYH